MNTTTLPNWQFVLLLIFGIWGIMVSLSFTMVFFLAWHDNFKAEREKRKLEKEQAQKYQHLAVYTDAVECVDLLESKNNVS